MTQDLDDRLKKVNGARTRFNGEEGVYITARDASYTFVDFSCRLVGSRLLGVWRFVERVLQYVGVTRIGAFEQIKVVSK